MRRKFFNFAAAVSLLLCAAVCVLWVRGCSGFDSARWAYIHDSTQTNTDDRLIHVSSGAGRFVLIVGAGGPNNSRESAGLIFDRTSSTDWTPDRWAVYEGHISQYRGWGPLRWQEERRSKAAGRGSYDYHGVRIAVSHWLVALLLAIAPAVWMARWRRVRHDVRKNLCASCGYDLRATPDRCPECGAVPREPPHNPPMHRTGPAV